MRSWVPPEDRAAPVGMQRIDADDGEGGRQARGKRRFKTALPPGDAPVRRSTVIADMRILVIEDERTLAGFIEQSLRAEGHAVTVCHDGPGGEAAALTGDYALVLLDLTLPGKDGLDVLAAIRSRRSAYSAMRFCAAAAGSCASSKADAGGRVSA